MTIGSRLTAVHQSQAFSYCDTLIHKATSLFPRVTCAPSRKVPSQGDVLSVYGLINEECNIEGDVFKKDAGEC